MTAEIARVRWLIKQTVNEAGSESKQVVKQVVKQAVKLAVKQAVIILYINARAIICGNIIVLYDNINVMDITYV